MIKKIFRFILVVIFSVFILTSTGCDFKIEQGDDINSILNKILDEMIKQDRKNNPDSYKIIDDKKKTDPVTPTMVTVKFMQDDYVLGEETFAVGSELNQPTFEMTDDAMYDYTFIGWDANGDNIPDTFPYSLTKDTTFKLLYNAELITYHYNIYDRKGSKVRSIDCHYGDTIDYPEISHEINGDDVYFFLGWEYNNVFDGYIYNFVTGNCEIKPHYATSQIIKHYYNGMLYPAYSIPDQELTFLDPWKVYAPAGFEIKWYLDTSKTVEFTGTKMIEGNLTLYGYNEEIDPDKGILVYTKQQLLQEFNKIVINRIEESILTLKYTDNSTANDIISYLIANGTDIYNYRVSATYQNSHLTLDITYDNVASKTSTTILYNQIQSLNLQSFTPTRDSYFNNFASDSYTTDYLVRTSDALYYALEKGYHPMIEADDTAMLNLYNTMKNVLRNIISDNMTDIEKAKAIYEYLIMNVTYDGDILNKMAVSENNVSEYRSFYLEGVFYDHLAVCDGISKAYVALCRMEGIPCLRVTGTTKSFVKHAWNKVYLNNNWYVVDATAGGTIANNTELLTYSYFMLSDEKYAEHATEDQKYNTNIKAVTNYDIYQNIVYNTTSGNVSLYATSVAQAKSVIGYLLNSTYTEASIDIKINVSGKTAFEVLNEALTDLHVTDNVTYCPSLNSVIIHFIKNN